MFGLSSGKFPRFMVSQWGVKANSEKVKAILDMTSPRSVKEVQRLTGQVISLNIFISRAMDKCLPLIKKLKQVFQWTEECEEAF